MPPVDVPAITSKSSAIRLPVRFSISMSTVAGMMPRSPPPSIARILISRAISAPMPVVAGGFQSSRRLKALSDGKAQENGVPEQVNVRERLLALWRKRADENLERTRALMHHGTRTPAADGLLGTR